MDIKRAHLITHKDCMDGSGCAVCFLVAGGNRSNVHLVPAPTHMVDSCLEYVLSKTNDTIILADVAISKEFAQELDGHRDNIIVLDHHKSAMELDRFSWCTVDKNNSKCGSSLLFDFLFKQNIENKFNLKVYSEVIEQIEDNDLWLNHIPESKELALFHANIGQNFFIERFMANPSLDFSAEEVYLLEIAKHNKEVYINKKLKDIVIRSVQLDNGDYVRVGFVYASSNQSELGNRAVNDLNIDIDTLFMISSDKVSCRSKKDSILDLSIVAKEYGGGGHKHAAGFPLNNLIGLSILELASSKIKL